MPKLLQLSVTANWGSTGKITEAIGKCAIGRGWESYIAYGRWSNPSESHLIKVGTKLDTYIHYACNRLFDMEGRSSQRATKALIHQIEALQPDVVQLHNIHDHYLNYPLLFRYLNKTDIKVVWTFHDCWPMTGKCAHFTKAGCYQWCSEEGCHECRQLSTYPDSVRDRSRKNYQLKKKLFTSVKDLHIVTVSEWLKSVCGQSYLKNIDVRCIHNGINTELFKPCADTNIDTGEKSILFVSNIWNGAKGEDVIKRLDENLPDEYKLTVVGKGSENLALNSKRIKAIPQTKDQAELAKLYSNSDVFVCTSVEESAPLVVLEAMACGTPVICFDSTGIPENVKENCGRIVKIGDFNELIQSITETAECKEKYSESCIKNIESEYTIEHMCESYYKLYRELMEE